MVVARTYVDGKMTHPSWFECILLDQQNKIYKRMIPSGITRKEEMMRRMKNVKTHVGISQVALRLNNQTPFPLDYL